jgi:hypothetical protein
MPLESQVVQVHLNAVGLDGGTYTGDLRVSSSHPRLEKNVRLTLNVAGAPNISLDNVGANIGDVPIGSDRGFYLRIKNNGTSLLTVTSITTDHSDFYVNQATPFSLLVGETILLAPQFRPTATGPLAGTFTIHSNDPDAGEQQFVLSGNGVYPPIPGMTPGSLSADLISGATSVQTVTVTNTGGSTMDYAVDFTPNFSWLRGATWGDMGAGGSRDIEITLDAGGKSAGVYTGKVTLWHHGDVYVEVPVTMTVNDATDIQTSTETIHFGDQFVDNTYDSIIQIKNNGVLPLSISSIQSDNPAFTITEAGPLNLTPGERVEAIVRFHPASVSSQSGLITFVSNDPDEATYTIELSGRGIDPPIVGANPGALSSSLFSGEAQTQSMTLSNTGGSVLRWRLSGQFSVQPMSGPEDGGPPQTAGQGDFSLRMPAPERLISMTVSPSGLIYGQAPHSQDLWAYNPQTNEWLDVGNVVSATTLNLHGGSVILNSRIYCVYSEDASKMFVYSFALKNWSTFPLTLGSGTSTITTDGNLIFVAGGGKFSSFNPATETWTELPIPTINLDGRGGLAYHDGVIYAHEGDGNGFARFTIDTQTWESLVPLPDKGSLGGTIDPVRKRYYTYGENAGGAYLYEYDIAAALWNVINFTLFDFIDGGIVYEPNAGVSGIYLFEGGAGNRLARYEPRNGVTWLRASPMAGEIDPADTESIGVNFNTYGLSPGTYQGTVDVISNDPDFPTKAVPVTFQVADPRPSIITPAQIAANVDRVEPFVTQLRIENAGRDPLDWSIPNIPSERISMSTRSGTVAGYGFQDITLTFDPFLLPQIQVSYILEIVSNDPTKPTATTNLTFGIPNGGPFVSTPFVAQVVNAGSSQLDLLDHFSDPDGDALTFTASSSNSQVASVTMANSTLSIVAVRKGSTSISVSAYDPFGAFLTSTFGVEVEIVTGLESSRKERNLTASPNPFATNLTIRYQTEKPEMAYMLVIDISGKVVWESGTYQEVVGANEIAIDGSRLSPGMYNCILMKGGSMNSSVRLVRN